jgi:hypothetical protein
LISQAGTDATQSFASDGFNPVLVHFLAAEPPTPDPIEAPKDDTKDPSNPTPFSTPVPTAALSNTLFERIKVILGSKIEETLPTPSLVNHSPGVSPTHSMATLTIEAVNSATEPEPTVDRQEEEPAVTPPVPTPVPAPVVIEPPSPISPEVTEECPLCHRVFTLRAENDRQEIIDHVHNCLFSTNIPPLPTEFSCPKCEQKFTGNNERAYMQHVTDCYNQD